MHLDRSPQTLSVLKLLDNLPSKRLLLNLHRFYTLAFWWPSLRNNGEIVPGSGMKPHHSALQVLAANFVKSVENFSKLYPSLGTYVDRPNIHRVLELVYHTITAFNHVGFVCELVFESAHQPLKFFLSRNHTLNSHVYSVQLILAKDWLIRVWSLWSIYKDDSESEWYRKNALFGLMRLFGGETADNIDWNSEAVSASLDEVREHIHYLMRGTIEKRLEKWYRDSRMTFNSEPTWVLHPPSKSFRFSTTQQQFLRKALGYIAKYSLRERKSFKLCYKALLDRGFGSSAKNSHERLHMGDVIQILISDGFENQTFLSICTSTIGSPTFFVIGGFIQCGESINWVVLKPCKLLFPSSLGQLPSTQTPHLIEVLTPDFYGVSSDTQTHYIQLSDEIRKVGVIHNCRAQNSCTFCLESRRVSHSSSTLGGGRFYILTRSLGYPARRS